MSQAMRIREEVEETKREDTINSYRCNVCSDEFNTVEELLVHYHEVHTEDETDIGFFCNRCQLEFSTINEIVTHDQQSHNGLAANIAHSEQLEANAETSNQESADGDQLTRITIVNNEGKRIGVADNIDEVVDAVANDEQVTALTAITPTVSNSSSRKRRPPQKYREEPSEATSSKRSLSNYNFAHSMETNKEDIELDISNLSCIRLRCGDATNSCSNREDEILSYLKQVDEKLECIIKHFNVPFKSTLKIQSPFAELRQSSAQNSICRTSKKSFLRHSKNKTNSPICTTLHKSHSLSSRNNLTSDISPPSISTSKPSTPSISFITCEAPPQEITQYVISDDLLEATYLKSRNRGNFSKNLVYAAFPLEERLGRNCFGRRGGSLCGPKEPLEAAKLEAVREAVFKKFPVSDGEDEEGIWKKECVIAIDTALRSEMRSRILGVQMKSEIKASTLMNMPM